jgi:hypothetical protein
LNDGIDNYQNSKNLSDADKFAIRYCELMATNPDAIDEAFYDELKKYYSLEEIVELGAFIGLNIGYHTFYGTLDFYPMFSPDGRLIDQEESRKIYGTEVKSLTGRGV